MPRPSHSALGVSELAESPVTPSSGEQIFYPKADGKWYRKNSAGTETAFILEGDARLTDARTPTTHSHDVVDVTGAQVTRAVRAATTANITLSAPQTIDGVAVIAGDRVLVKNQTLGQNNGIYVVAAGAWTRATDHDTAAEIARTRVYVTEGTVNVGRVYGTPFPLTGTVGTTAQVYNLAEIHAGGTKSATTFLRGDDTWVVPTNTTYPALTEPNAAAGTATTASTIDASILRQAIYTHGGSKAVRVATTTNITLTGTQTINGVALAAGDRVLVKDQLTASQNGLYVVAAGAWTRLPEADTATEVANSIVVVREGTLAGSIWETTFTPTDTLGTTAMNWYAFLTSQTGVSTTDPRLTDARTPTTHSHPTSEVSGLDAALALLAPKAGPAFTGSATLDGQALVKTNDSRLSDARTPTTHTHVPSTGLAATGTPDETTFLRGDNVWATPEGSGGGAATLDELTDVAITAATTGQVVYYNGTSWVNLQLGTANITGLDTALGLLAPKDSPAFTTAATLDGVALVKTNDSRLTDARTPVSHNHPVTDLTATGTRDGSVFLRGDNVWAKPLSAGGDTVVSAKVYTGTISQLISATSQTDIDATNLAVSFTTPSSGIVLIDVEIYASSADSNLLTLGLREGSTLVGEKSIAAMTAARRIRTTFYVSGLTAGSTHTYKLSAKVAGGTGTTFTTGTGNPGQIIVYSGDPSLSSVDLQGVADTYLPGRELAHAERTTAFTNTNTTAYGVTAGMFIDGLSVNFTGTGRPVDIEFTGLVRHSVANTIVGFYLLQDGAAQGHIGSVFSPSTSASIFTVQKRRLIVANGVNRTFTMGVYGSVAGTNTLSASASMPLQLSIIGR